MTNCHGGLWNLELTILHSEKESRWVRVQRNEIYSSLSETLSHLATRNLNFHFLLSRVLLWIWPTFPLHSTSFHHPSLTWIKHDISFESLWDSKLGESISDDRLSYRLCWRSTRAKHHLALPSSCRRFRRDSECPISRTAPFQMLVVRFTNQWVRTLSLYVLNSNTQANRPMICVQARAPWRPSKCRIGWWGTIQSLAITTSHHDQPHASA